MTSSISGKLSTGLFRSFSRIASSASQGCIARHLTNRPVGHTRQIFSALDCNGDSTVSSTFFIGFLSRNGLTRTDKRLASLFSSIDKLGGVDAEVFMTIEQFDAAISGCTTLIHKCVVGQLRVPDFQAFTDVFKQVYADVEPDKSGENAGYIPQLATVDPEQFGISVTTVDGQHFSIGDTDKQFCIQSCSKPITYLLGLKQFGADYVHNCVGTEPSGHAFNEMILKDKPSPENPSRRIPHNPCINAGAIMAASMAYPEFTRAERLEKVLDIWRRLSGGSDAPIGYDDETYRSESGSADRNWCLGYMMKERDAFPPCFSSLPDTLELYFQFCSILSTCSAMSQMSATLANGGLNPCTGDRIFEADHVRSVLPIMLMAGMYDYSGQWAYDIGVPAKSGVGGCVFVVVPNVCGISIWSPRLDSVGNSQRGVRAATELVKHFAFHNFEVFSGLSRTKIDPTKRKNSDKQAALADLLFAASSGDVSALAQQKASGIDIFAADYDNRTALHLAASEGHLAAVKFLVESAPDDKKSAVVTAADRWGGTALDDAVHNGFTECAAVLKAAGATKAEVHHAAGKISTSSVKVDDDAPRILFAAADGDLDELIKLAASGHSLSSGDYDMRTALHLAASNGHADVIKYLLAQAGPSRSTVIAAQDRFGSTAADDAVREGHSECALLLK